MPLIFLPASLLGCAQAPARTADTIAQWSLQQGGEVHDSRLDRLRAAGSIWKDYSAITLRFHVLNTSKVVAYSWPTGDVFCSTGLLTVATDTELTAAVAHELGHLLDDAKARTAVSLGGKGSLQIEELADDRALMLLQRAHLPAASLATLLSKVSQASYSAQTRGDIQQRIDRICVTK